MIKVMTISIILMLVILIAACNIQVVTPRNVEAADIACAPHKGVRHYVIDTDYQAGTIAGVRCVDGVYVSSFNRPSP